MTEPTALRLDATLAASLDAPGVRRGATVSPTRALALLALLAAAPAAGQTAPAGAAPNEQPRPPAEAVAEGVAYLWIGLFAHVADAADGLAAAAGAASPAGGDVPVDAPQVRRAALVRVLTEATAARAQIDGAILMTLLLAPEAERAAGLARLGGPAEGLADALAEAAATAGEALAGEALAGGAPDAAVWHRLHARLDADAAPLEAAVEAALAAPR